jgi:hypothetical protein
VQTADAWQYTVADGDNASYLALRCTGQTKDAQGNWEWKALAFADPPMDVTGAVPVPWQKGQTFVLPGRWQDIINAKGKGAPPPRSGSKGPIVLTKVVVAKGPSMLWRATTRALSGFQKQSSRVCGQG